MNRPIVPRLFIALLVASTACAVGDVAEGDPLPDPGLGAPAPLAADAGAEGGDGCTSDFDCAADELCELGRCTPVPEPGPICGDGNLDPGEECDLGVHNDDHGGCKSDCTRGACGDGRVGPGEACDDGNDADDDGCTSACRLASCGDGVVQAPEACDDGNPEDSDACLSTCTAASCGDGVVQTSVEECDGSDGCLGDCRLAVSPTCGNGIADPGERCLDRVVDVPTRGVPVDVALGDFDGDGHLDVVTGDGQVTVANVMRGVGDGTFAAGVPFTWRVESGDPDRFVELAVADVDGDALADLCGVLGGDGRAMVSCRKGTGDDEILGAVERSWIAGLSPRGLVLHDVEGDAMLDSVTVAIEATSGIPSVYSFVRPVPAPAVVALAADLRPNRFAIGKLLADAPPMIVVSDLETGSISSPSALMDLRVEHPLAMATGDVTGDGIDDLLLTQWDQQGCPRTAPPDSCALGHLSLVPGGKAAADLEVARSWLVGQGPGELELVDVDRDGALDVVVGNAISEDLTILENDRAGGFRTPRTIDLGPCDGDLAMTVGDVDEDGVVDVVTVHAGLGILRTVLSNP